MAKKQNIKKLDNKNKVNYNPFKMWGSWVGLGVLGLYTLFFNKIKEMEFNSFNYYTPFEAFTGKFEPFLGLLNPILYFILAIVLGFLIGWAIHSLIRYLKNRSKN